MISGRNCLAPEQKLGLQMDVSAISQIPRFGRVNALPMDKPDSGTVTYVSTTLHPMRMPPVQSCREMAPAPDGLLPTGIPNSGPCALFNQDFSFEHPVVIFCARLSRKSSIKHPDIWSILRAKPARNRRFRPTKAGVELETEGSASHHGHSLTDVFLQPRGRLGEHFRGSDGGWALNWSVSMPFGSADWMQYGIWLILLRTSAGMSS